ncbi:ABC transporter permease [Salinibacterium sp. G-O1]|uniref:ABC transporter permease n=1 Tax=Salinibacterium sp. G-O1 TaxID=3046208 RepID=UPI0024B9253C|nr:ABC transporter permease [Salinibacterium sp. G-O1]MDJ0333934.1 ABC transporter permease [Salinibacterium sp. G-O1]
MTSTEAIVLAKLPRSRRRHPIVVWASIALLAIVTVLAIFGNLIAPDATAQSILDSLLPPGSPGHLLGTDELGRDVLALTIAGAASALVGPVCVALGSMLLGILLGTVSGYLRGPVDFIIGRWTDLLFSLPLLLAAIVVAGIFGAGYWMTVLLLILLFSPSDIRIVRAGVMEQAARPFVEAAQMLSLSKARIMFTQVLPNVWSLIITNSMLNVAFALVAFSSLSFLGVGVAPGTADWGRQLTDGRAIMIDNPAAILVPALLIIGVASAANLVGDWLGQNLTRTGRS